MLLLSNELGSREVIFAASNTDIYSNMKFIKSDQPGQNFLTGWPS